MTSGLGGTSGDRRNRGSNSSRISVTIAEVNCSSPSAAEVWAGLSSMPSYSTSTPLGMLLAYAPGQVGLWGDGQLSYLFWHYHHSRLYVSVSSKQDISLSEGHFGVKTNMATILKGCSKLKCSKLATSKGPLELRILKVTTDGNFGALPNGMQGVSLCLQWPQALALCRDYIPTLVPG